MRKIASVSLVGAGLILPIVAAAVYLSSEDRPLVLQESAVIAEGVPGSQVVLKLLISNQREHAVDILGASIKQSCLLSGCAKDAPDLPVRLNGHESKVIRVVYEIGSQRTPPYVLVLYTNHPSQPTLSVTIRNKYLKAY